MSKTTGTVKVQTIASRNSFERMPSSRNGNPRFRVTFTDGTSAPTMPDTMWAYGAANPEHIGVELEVHYNGRGHITYARPVTR